MPLFDFKAMSAQGKTQRGIIEAENVRAARQKLKKQNLIVTDIKEKTAQKSASSGGVPFLGNNVTVKDMATFTRQLASLIKANIPLVEALNALVDQLEKEPLKVAVGKVRDDLNEGSSLAKALALHPKIFDNIFINMVEAGESSGTLSLVLLKLADLKESQMRLKQKVQSAMTYPVLMLAVASLLLIAIFTFVIPKLAQVFVSTNKPLPPSTKFLMATSDFILGYWYLLAAMGWAAFWMLKRYIASPVGKPKWHHFQLNAPIYGSLTRMVAVTRFASTMSTLLGSGVPILSAMGIARNLVGNMHIAKAIEDARENITEGQSIAEPLKRSGQFPPLVIHMIMIGEKTGELPDMLKNVAETYEEQVSNKIEGMTALLEPLMIIGMGGLVGFIVMSIFVPLLEIGNIN